MPVFPLVRQASHQLLTLVREVDLLSLLLLKDKAFIYFFVDFCILVVTWILAVLLSASLWMTLAFGLLNHSPYIYVCTYVSYINILCKYIHYIFLWRNNRILCECMSACMPRPDSFCNSVLSCTVSSRSNSRHQLRGQFLSFWPLLFFSHCCSQAPNRGKLREAGFVWAGGLRG